MKKVCALVLSLVLPFQAVVASALGHCPERSAHTVAVQFQPQQSSEMSLASGHHDHQSLHQKTSVETPNSFDDHSYLQAQDSHRCGTCHSGCTLIALLLPQGAEISSVQSVEPADINRLQALSPPLDQPERPQWASRA
jgi:hypothetical protein